MAYLSTILKKDPATGIFRPKTIGQMGSWVDPNTGVGYSGPKQRETDVAYVVPTQVGQSQPLAKNPIIPKPIVKSSSPVQIPPAQPIEQNYPPLPSPALPPQEQQPQEDPITKFNLAILDMLKKAQNSGGNENLYAQQTALQRAQIGRTSAMTPEDQQVLSPSQQASIRSGSADALSPEIDAISAKIKASDSRLQNFESILSTMRQMGMDIGKLNPSADILEGYKKMVEQGGSLSEIPDDVVRNKVASMVDWKKAESARYSALKQEEAIKHSYDKAPAADKGPASYQEWSLAGGLEGTGKTYAQFVENVKPATVAQQTVATYAARLEQANPLLKNLEKTIVGMNPLNFEAQVRLPSYLQSADMKQYMQAARNFINSVLRRESGAVISPSEFDNAYQQYLPRPNDDVTTLQNKETNRDIVYESFKKGAGQAYESLDTLIGSKSSGSNKPASMKTPDGKVYDLQADGTYKLRK